MNNDFFIKNFRVFDKNGVVIPLKPLTVLTGCNSSGKSSIVKSMVLFDSYLKGLLNDFNDRRKVDPLKYILDFSSRENASLGGFSRVLYRNSRDNFIDLGYTVHSLLLCEDVNVIFRFATDKYDKLDNGYIKGFSIKTPKGAIIYQSYAGGEIELDLNIVLSCFIRYYYGQNVIEKYKERDYNYIGIDRDLDDYYGKLLEDYEKEYGEEALKDITKREHDIPQLYQCLTNRESLFKKDLNDSLISLEIAKKHDTLFYTPIDEKLFPMNKQKMKEYESQLKKKERFNYHVSNVFRDFYNSKYKTFGDYFRQKESEFLKFKHVTEEGTLSLIDFKSYDEMGRSEFIRDDKNVSKLIRDPLNGYSFMNVYDALLYLEHKGKVDYSNLYDLRDLKLFEMLKDYFSQFFEEVMTISMPHNLSYVSSSLVNVKRLYSLENTDSFSILLKNYFSAERFFFNTKHEEETYQPGCFMNKWLKKLGIGDSIKMQVDDTQTGVTIRLFKNRKDKLGSLLSEQGYGITQLFVILLRIETAILNAQRYVSNDNFVVYELLSPNEFRNAYAPSTIAIEEPEIHQHPKFQSMLADIFADAYCNYNVQFIIETHSEYLIRKLQNLVANKTISKDDVSLVYVYDADPKKRPFDTPQVKTINILSDGRLADKFGEGFFDEADRLAMDLFKM